MKKYLVQLTAWTMLNSVHWLSKFILPASDPLFHLCVFHLDLQLNLFVGGSGLIYFNLESLLWTSLLACFLAFCLFAQKKVCWKPFPSLCMLFPDIVHWDSGEWNSVTIKSKFASFSTHKRHSIRTYLLIHKDCRYLLWKESRQKTNGREKRRRLTDILSILS